LTGAAAPCYDAVKGKAKPCPDGPHGIIWLTRVYTKVSALPSFEDFSELKIGDSFEDLLLIDAFPFES